MDILIFAFGSVVTLLVGAALAIGIVANNRQIETDAQNTKAPTAP